MKEIKVFIDRKHAITDPVFRVGWFVGSVISRNADNVVLAEVLQNENNEGQKFFSSTIVDLDSFNDPAPAEPEISLDFVQTIQFIQANGWDCKYNNGTHTMLFFKSVAHKRIQVHYDMLYNVCRVVTCPTDELLDCDVDVISFLQFFEGYILNPLQDVKLNWLPEAELF